MKNFGPRWRMIVQVLLFSATAFLVCGVAQAQVNGFVVVNPIVVCDSNGANCAPFGVQCSTNTKTGAYSCIQSGQPSTATASTPIGFVDGDTNTNLTRAILAASAGIDVAFFPVVQYNSPNTNTDPWPKLPTSYSTTNYQHLHLKNVTCKDGTVVLASPDLAALTQHQICTEHKGVPAGVSNPPPSPSPAPPLGSTLGESNALDLFFVADFNQAVFGVSWINGDGVSIAGPATFLVTGPRFDNLAHEIGHALALDHGGTTGSFGLASNTTTNMMTSGSTRVVPSTSGCAKPGTYFNVLNPLGGALYDLNDPAVYPAFQPVFAPCPSPGTQATQLADQLTSGTACTALDSTCTNQVGALSLSPFINKTLAATATSGGGAQAAVANAALTNCPPPGGVPFAINAATGTGEDGDAIASIIIALSPTSGLSFSGSAPATQTPCGTGGVEIISQVRLNGNNGIGNPNCVKSINLAPPAVQCVQIFFSTGGSDGAAFVAGDTVTFNLALSQDKPPFDLTQLVGSQLTIITSAGFATTTNFRVDGTVLSADSRSPDFTTPNQIDPGFVNSKVRQLGPKLSKCTPPYVGSGKNQQCPGTSVSAATDCPIGVLACSD